MQRDWFGYAVHREIAEDIAFIRRRLFHTAALKRDFGKFRRAKKFRTTQMGIAFGNTCIDALHLNRCRDRRFLGMLTIHKNRSAKLFEATGHGGKSLLHLEADARMCRIDFVIVARGDWR